MLHPETNSGKLSRLDALLIEYVAYVKTCIEMMLSKQTFNLPKKEKQTFFPPAENLTSQIEKNARDHAIGIVSGWARSAYTNKIQKEISRQKREGPLDNEQARRLYIVGKYLKQTPDSRVSQEDIDLYWTLLRDTKNGVKPPSVTEKIGMRLSEMTSRLESPDETNYADFWFRISTLEARKSLWLPLVGSLYVKSPDDVGKGFLARKTSKGRWRIEALDTRTWEVPEAPLDAPRVGVDVGLNVIAATSDGRLYGQDLKPKFNRLYARVKEVRANRQRQDLKENSPRLARLENRLSGLTKSAVGTVSNRLIQDYPDHVFVIEDLDLSGCRGQKRFCYRALHHSLGMKATTQVVNPAFTSQMCPSCGHIDRRNRRGIKFQCRSCGRESHADVVGGINLLGRSEDKQVGLADHPSVVKRVLRERSRLKRRVSSLGNESVELIPISPRFTVGGTSREGRPCIASK